MSYDTTRDAEQLRVLDHSIDDFITRYNNSNGPLAGSRQTVFLFPGGMASRLKRATQRYVDGLSTPQAFAYRTIWLTPDTFLGDALALQMHKVAGKHRDKGDRIIVADGLISFLGCTTYDGFIDWCRRKRLDYYVFGWDWRRRVDQVGRLFVNKFLPHFQERVKNECNNADPLCNFSLIGHSAGGMVVNWILRKNHPNVAKMQHAITVATPFYGYAGQAHRWFEGEPYLNFLGKSKIVKVICSLPGVYAFQFLDYQTFVANQAALANDGVYSLPTYPSLDKATNAIADPYNPTTNGPYSRYPPAAAGFDAAELRKAKRLVRLLARDDLNPLLAPKFVNIRGDDSANDTVGSTTWDWVPPTDPTPIANASTVRGDGTQPAWTARHVGLANAVPANVMTVTGSSVEHQSTMNSAKTLDKLAGVLGV